jgi:hypothetical protein
MFVGMYFLQCGNESAISSGNGDVWTISSNDIYYEQGFVRVGTVPQGDIYNLMVPAHHKLQIQSLNPCQKLWFSID